jgi:hypothetical protein
MSQERPRVSPQLVATVIESAPDRVRRRLDRAPNTAADWDWQPGEGVWSVDTGGETVTLPQGHVQSMDQLSCSCLLSPNCFHVLACLTTLQIAVAGEERVESAEAEAGLRVDSPTSSVARDVVQPGEKQRRAAATLVEMMSRLLRVGVANAGVVVQSGLLRAIHQCRAEGLHRAAAIGLRVIAGTNQFRARSPESDPPQLAEDLADALETTRRILGEETIPGFWIGTARRRQMPVRPRKLHGLLAEPVVTRSGFAGAAAYFLGEDDHIYTASDVRPGDAQHARDAYRGGIEIGSLIQPARQLARGLYLGTDLTASEDGRLGRGKGIKIVEQGRSSWKLEAVQRRFQRPLSEQWSGAYAAAALPADARPAGWDFVFVSGVVIGAVGAELLFQITLEDQPIRLAIENESEELGFRENLRMLSHAPGLKLQIIARLNLQQPTVVNPLAIAEIEPDLQEEHAPRMDLPEALHGRVLMGFDELQRKHLRHAQAAPVVLGERQARQIDDPLASLHRRWIAMMLAGTATQPPSNTNTIAAEMAMLDRSGFATGAALLDALARSHSSEGPGSVDKFLATSLYLRSCRYELAEARATLEMPGHG